MDDQDIVVPAIPANEDDYTDANHNHINNTTDDKRKHRAKALTPKQAVTKFWNRGIFIAFHDPRESRPDAAVHDFGLDPEGSGGKPKYIVRCKCNPVCKTSFDGWDAYAYNRHFNYKKHRKWEGMRAELGWDEGEAYRDFVKFIELTLDDSDLEDHDPTEDRAVKRARRALDENTIDAIIRVEAQMRDPNSSSKLKAGFQPGERRKQEAHYMKLWKEARAELRNMRAELMNETDEDAIEDIRRDMVGLMKKKSDLARFLGIETDNVVDANEHQQHHVQQQQHVADMAHGAYDESLMETKLEV